MTPINIYINKSIPSDELFSGKYIYKKDKVDSKQQIYEHTTHFFKNQYKIYKVGLQERLGLLKRNLSKIGFRFFISIYVL